MSNVKVWAYYFNKEGLRAFTEWTTDFDEKTINRLFRFHNMTAKERQKLGLSLAIEHNLNNVLTLRVSHILSGYEMDQHNGCGGFVEKHLLGVGYEAKTYLVKEVDSNSI